ncbi:MAG: hypothetical protein A3J28_13425 [Acidobacteria bacterium RIFCSPLOWO2_12_FULL_60_22]|nr:MAG: hypothetical protein A3J28_13425 [Acidobacteria bacterium RIFCSPLOWO2_12_FULL_60_22]
MYGKSERGFSFVEVLVVTSMFAFLTSGATTVVSHFRQGRSKEARREAVSRGRAAVDQMVRELRLAGYPTEHADRSSANLTAANSNSVADTFLVATASQVVFEADLDGDGVIERVEYRLNGAALERRAVSKNPDGSVPAARYEILAENVDNGATPLFTYTANPLSALPAPGNFVSVRVSLQLRTLPADPKSRQYRTLRLEGEAHRQSPNG